MKENKLTSLSLAACFVLSATTTYGSQRFLNLARYATAAAARCSQAFQTIKQSKPVQWAANHKVAITGTAIATGLIANQASLIDYTIVNPIDALLFKKKIKALFASQGIELSDSINTSRFAFLSLKGLEDIHYVADHFFYIVQAFSAKDSSNLANAILTNHFNDLTFLQALSIISQTTHKKIEWLHRLLEKNDSTIYSSIDIIDLSSILDSLSAEEAETFVTLFIKRKFTFLSGDAILRLIRFIEKMEDRLHYLKKTIEDKKIDSLYISKDLGFSKNQYDALVMLYLEKEINTLNEFSIFSLIDKLSLEADKIKCIKIFIQNSKINSVYSFETAPFTHIFEFLTLENRYQLALFYLKHFDGIDHIVPKCFMNCFSQDKQATLFKKFAAQNPLLSMFTAKKAAQGPLFSFEFLMKQSQNIDPLFTQNIDPLFNKIQNILNKIILFTEQEYAKGNIVLFHGQNDQWAFFEKIFKALLKIKYSRTIPNNYAFLRFEEQALLSDKQVAEIRKDGVTSTTFSSYRQKVLFTNLHLLANHSGSNSLVYALSNTDQSSGREFNFTIGADQFFTLSMTNEYNQILQENPTVFHRFYTLFEDESDKLQEENPLVFEKLYDLYKKEVIARGNTGRLIAISLPKEVAQSLCYPTRSGAPLSPIIINGEPITDLVTIAQNYDQVPFDNEYCLILSDLITNPEKAAAAGIIMETFASEPTEESLKCAEEFEKEFEKVMNRIEQLYKQHTA